ncbi:hypothetical protein [Variovorax paradoxus]|uniref:hypothetical protein n=1 Tax=Variovorax paradoxus TaxID=34073 RepID=UPI0024815ADC|nr:hypothetical protein [Variovorax paradoxus]WGT61491.1 hypothetical protein QHG62_15515 [Variovorax paradoxus]
MPKGTANPQPLRCLVRSSDGWWVQLSRNGIEHRHLFKFGAIRSEPEALALAQARRDQLMQEHPEIARWRTIERAICNGKPGGVVYVAGPDKQSSCWCAETPMADGTVMRETFSIARFSKTAKQLAIAERERQLNLMVAGFAVKAELDAASNRLGNGQNDAAMYGIVRHKTYWLVKLERSRQRFSKTFSFAKLGGVQDALAQAQAWRDDIVRQHPPVMRQQRANKLRSNNKTGIVGVTCVLGPDGRPRQWSAHTYIGPGQLLQKTFSVYRHGEDAQTLAIAERQKQLAQMEGRARLHPVEEQVRSSSTRRASRQSVRTNGRSSDGARSGARAVSAEVADSHEACPRNAEDA